LIGPYGAPIGEIVGLGSMGLFLLWLMRRVGMPLGVQTGPILKAAAACALCYLVGTRLAHYLGAARWPVEALTLLLYPLLLVVTRAIPREHFGPLARIGQNTLPRTRRSPLLSRVPAISPRRRHVLEAIARDRRPPAAVAAEHGLTIDEVGVRLTRALRQLTGAGQPGDEDLLLGQYLLYDAGPGDRDAAARALTFEGVDALDIHELDAAFMGLRRTPHRAWRKL
jgi:hypothetical protein